MQSSEYTACYNGWLMKAKPPPQNTTKSNHRCNSSGRRYNTSINPRSYLEWLAGDSFDPNSEKDRMKARKMAIVIYDNQLSK